MANDPEYCFRNVILVALKINGLSSKSGSQAPFTYINSGTFAPMFP